MQGSFDITCARRSDGITSVTRQSISVPWHLSKPYWTGEVLIVQAVNATAGIFAGDQLDFRVQLESGASVLLTSPSANKIYTMPHGEATLRQHIHVATGSWLEWMPELFIPQRDCRYRQHTEIHVERGGRAYFVETLAPGRVAHGEAFAFSHLDWTTRIHHAGKLVLAEHYPMSPGDQSLRDLTKADAPRYFASAMVVHDGALPVREWQETMSQRTSPDVHIGATQLDDGVILFRMLTSGSEILKSTLSELRMMLSAHLPGLNASPRKL